MLSIGGKRVKVPLWLVPLVVAVIVATDCAPTATVFTLKVVDDAPAGTVTDIGTVALLMLEAKLTTAPVGPAWPVRVTVAVAVFPPTSEVGAMTMLRIPGGFIVRVAA